MKKLITIMAAAASALFAFGGVEVTLPSGTSFEGYGENAFAPDKSDTGATGVTFWYTAGDANNNTFVLSNYTGSASASTPDVVSRPDYFAESVNSTFLSIDTGDRLYRSAIENDQDGEFYSVAIPADKGIYLDTLVKFTPADDDTSLALEPNADKIAIAYVAHEDDAATPEVNEAYTNFVVQAGYLGSPLSVTNYFAAVPENFDKDAWHRLTVRSFASIDEAGHVGFVVYLDEVPLQYGTAVDAGPGFAATGAAAAFYTSEVHALFPSAVQSGDNKSSIAAVAFTGNGSVDDVTFTTDTPNFIKAGEAVRTEITLGTGVASVTVTVGGNTINPEDAAASPLVFNLPAGTTSFVLGVTADTANDYTFDEATGITLTDATYASADDTVTITGASPALTVVGKRDNAYYMDGETKVGFTTLSDAFKDAPAGVTLKLGYDYVVAENEGAPAAAPVFAITKDFVLDLNGKTLNGGGSDYFFMFSVAADVTFTVIDSVEGDTGSIVYTGSYGMFGGDGETYIGSTALTDYGPVIEGSLIGDEFGYVQSIIRGKFSAADNTDNEEFAAAMCLDLGSDVELVGNYWVVAPKGGSEPTTYAISWTLTGGTTEATAGDFEENATIVFTADSGKTLSYVEIDGVEDTSAYGASSYTYTVGTADAVLEVTFTTPAPTTYEVTWTLTGGTTTATSGDDFAENDTIVFTAESGKTLSYVSIDGTEISDTSVYGASSYTYTVGTADAELVVTFTAGSSGWEPDPSKIDPSATAADTYPELDGTPLATANAKKLTAWAAAESIDFAAVTGDADAYVNAFLLNCAPAEVEAAKADFKATITVNADGTVTVTAPGDYNVTPTIQGKASLSGSEAWHTKKPGDKFFRAILSL